MYIVTNKGSVKTFDLENFTEIENNIPKVPLNFGDLILAGYPYDDDFSVVRFRVNGIYVDSINAITQVLFASHNAYNSQKDCITHNISRIELKVNNGSVIPKDEWDTIFTASPCIDPQPDHFLEAGGPYPGHISGGAIVSFNERKLLVTVGDYDRNGIDGLDLWAMDPSNPYGKFILVDKKTGEWSVFAMGSRNPTGLYIDKDSVIWSVENGPRGGDELNIIEKGKNYGWPRVSYGIWYGPTLKLPGGYKAGTHPVYQKPIFAWVPSVAPSDIIKITGEKFDYWKGDFLVGTMRDQSLRRLRINEKNRVVYDERIELGQRVRDLTILPDDKIALITDDGYLFIIGDGGPVFHKIDSTITQRMALLNNYDRFVNKTDTLSVFKAISKTPLGIFKQHCASCHNLNPGNGIGPHLHNLFNRKVGGLDDFSYSRSLKNDTRIWNAELLRSFLNNPQKDFPGSKMPQVNLSSNEIDSLIKLFQKQSSDN